MVLFHLYNHSSIHSIPNFSSNKKVCGNKEIGEIGSWFSEDVALIHSGTKVVRAAELNNWITNIHKNMNRSEK